jgi:hypothetical protein
MPKEQSPGKPTTRRYSDQEKAAAVRMVRTLRAELGTRLCPVTFLIKPGEGLQATGHGMTCCPCR